MNERLMYKNDRANLREQRRQLETSASELREGIREELYDMKPIEEVDTQKALDMLLVMIQQIEQIRGIDAKIEILNRKLDSCESSHSDAGKVVARDTRDH